jgi:UDP-glucose 4-epimerase
MLRPDDGTVAILGGLGFLGSHICRELVAQGFVVRIFDKLPFTNAFVADIEHNVEIVEGDFSRPQEVLNAIADASTVIHLIHTTIPGSSMDDPEYDITSNVAASVKWLMRLAETRIRRILYVSSGGTVYGIPETIPISETHPTNPVCSYGITKLAIEKYIAMYASMQNVGYCILRPSNVYGVGQRLDSRQGVIGGFIHRALCGKPLEIWGKGTSVRDFLYIDDLVDAMLAILTYTGPHHIFNVSNEEGYSLLELIAILRDQLGSLPPIIYSPDRGFDVPVNILDSSRLHSETGWQAHVGIENGIIRTIEWLKNSTANRTICEK